MLIYHKGHTDTIQVYSVTVMTHVKALQAGHSSQGTSEPITPGQQILKRPRPSICLFVCLSVMFSFRTVTQKRITAFSRHCRYVHHGIGMCCIVFDIYWMLFEFFMNFEILNFLFFWSHFMCSSRFMLFPTF